MGRTIKQVIWMNFSMSIGAYLGFKLSDFLFWSDDIKYRIWEETEDEFWAIHTAPKNLDKLVKFDSAISPGKIYYSYLPSIGLYIEQSYYDRYKI